MQELNEPPPSSRGVGTPNVSLTSKRLAQTSRGESALHDEPFDDAIDKVLRARASRRGEL